MDKLEIQQGGFREGRSTLDQVVCLDDFIKIHKKKFKKFPFVAYLDIKAAYDSVDRGILFDEFIKKGIHPIVVEMLKQLFEYNKARINIAGAFSPSFHMRAGVQQGSILSPLLYSIFIDKIIKELNSGPGLSMHNGTKLNCLLYADDIALVAKSAKEMNILLKISNKVAMNNNFVFNTSKCAYTGTRQVILMIGKEKIQKVDNFTYLGVQFNYAGINTMGQVQAIKDKLERKINFFTFLGIRVDIALLLRVSCIRAL